jgi:hydroxylaminobenzene mutase
MDKMTNILGKGGFLLFTFGLILGAAIPRFHNPRMGLSAHLSAVQIGIALIAFALFWQHFGVSRRFSGYLAYSLLLSSYALVAGLILSAVFGTGRTLPIAGRGFSATNAQELIVAIIVRVSSIWMFITCAAISFFSFRKLDQH